MDICTFIDSLNCLADLHLHLDGSVSVASARRLAAIENVSLPDDDSVLKSMLMVPEDCSDLNEYLERFSLPVSLMQHRESLKAAAEDLCLTLAEKGLMYAEIRFAPQKHCEKGLTQEEVVKAVLDGIAASGFRAGLILCCMRDGSDNRAENLETVRLSYEFQNKGVCACDLAGA
ncbi:MAG: adenosine deaminase, partial [Oscillospiraceae bacterium]|nr:adenosine deaminase [Oscillospiraceae bacterium]